MDLQLPGHLSVPLPGPDIPLLPPGVLGTGKGSPGTSPFTDPIPGTGASPLSAVTSLPEAIGKIGDAIQGITNFFTEWLLNPGRLVKLIGGGILLLMGINAAIKQTTGVNIGGTAKRAGEAAAGAAAAAAA